MYQHHTFRYGYVSIEFKQIFNNNKKIKPTITKAETRMKSKRSVKQIKTKESDLINDIVNPKKNDGKRKQSQR